MSAFRHPGLTARVAGAGGTGPALRGVAAVALAALLAAAVVTVGIVDVVAAPQTGTVRPEVDALFATWDRPDSPGCALGVVQNGELAYGRGYGSANLDWRIPIATDTVFYVGSVSKQFTASAIALLALEGEISLDDDIREYFPEMPAYERPVTVRHLVHHTSGLRDIYTLMALAGIRLEDVFSDEEAIALIAAQRETNFAPGDEYLYSNSGYFLLAQLVERVTGKPLREYVEEQIFAPLGMRDTHFHDDPGHVVARRAISYGNGEEGTFRVTYLGNFDKVGAGGLYSTVEDLLRWDRNFYSGDVGGERFLELIQTPGGRADGQPLTYAFGLTVDAYRGARTVSHSGSMMGFKAAFLQFPEHRFSVLAACNLGSIAPMDIAYRVADIWLDERLEPAADEADENDTGRQAGEDAGTFTSDELVAYAGNYHSAELDVDYRLVAEGDELWLELRDTPRRRLQRLGRDAARAGSWRLSFRRDERGGVRAFAVDAGRVTGIRFERR